ncbi:sodium/proline symporter PutP [Rothia sp. LK2588]|uniref:sodium/proline symporter PutP n=1 Tax=Rothia sp. LK2588 TaxID=3114369 RepID=UPI0034D02056
MSATTWQIIALAIYFLAMIAIGLWAKKQNTDLEDYVLGGRRLSPTTAALSAGASDMSGWLLMGLPGALYMAGLAQGWLAIGLTIGAWVNWKIVAPRLRIYTEVSKNSVTVPVFFHNRLRDNTRILRVLTSVITLIFFTFYASSGMVAGGKFFQSSFGLDFHTGMLLVAGVTVLYTLFGGFLGASYTDMVQGLIMLAALLILPVMALFYVGGPVEAYHTVVEVNPNAMSLFAGTTALGIISTAAWGLGYFGQPHIITRFMALRSHRDAGTARRIGIGWMVLTVVGAASAGLIGVAYFARHPEATLTDKDAAESVFLDLSQLLLHPFVAGFILSAVLAAIMSTLSSQLVVCSSALAEDIYGAVTNKKLIGSRGLWIGRAGVLVISVIAALLAWNPDSSVLQLVAFAWAGFGAAFGPIVLLSLFWRKLTNWGAIVGIIGATITVFVWGNSPLAETMYEIVPGFIVNLILAVGVSLATYRRNPEIEAEFDETLAALKA